MPLWPVVLIVILAALGMLFILFRPAPDPYVRRVTGARNSRERRFGDTQY